MLFGDRVAPARDASAAAWVAPRIGAFGTVGGLVPSAFDRYLRLEHVEGDGSPNWAAPSDLLDVLASVGARHTSSTEAWFAVWEGYGWERATRMYSTSSGGPLARLRVRRQVRRLAGDDRRRNDEVRSSLASLVAFELPNRRYYLLRGPVSAVSAMAAPDGSGRQSPDLWWPDDRAWFVATDTDLDWSYVGCPAAMSDEVVAALPGRTSPVAWSASNAEVAP